MPRLNGGLVVLEDDFNEVVEGGIDNGGAEDCRAWSGRVLDGVEVKYTRNFEIISELQWGGWINVGDPVNCISKLPTDLCLRIC